MSAQGTARALERLGIDGDAGAWRWLVERHGAAMERVALGLLGDADQAEDALQEVFVRLPDAARSFRVRRGYADPDAAAVAWLLRLIAHQAAKIRRGDGRRRRREDAVRADVPGCTDDHVDAPLIADELAGLLRRELDRLPERQRQPLVLHFFAGQDYAQVAETLACSAVNARVRVHRAVQRLRGRLLQAGAAGLTIAGLCDHLHAAAAGGDGGVLREAILGAQDRFLVVTEAPASAVPAACSGGLPALGTLSAAISTTVVIGLVTAGLTVSPGAERALPTPVRKGVGPAPVLVDHADPAPTRAPAVPDSARAPQPAPNGTAAPRTAAPARQVRAAAPAAVVAVDQPSPQTAAAPEPTTSAHPAVPATSEEPLMARMSVVPADEVAPANPVRSLPAAVTAAAPAAVVDENDPATRVHVRPFNLGKNMIAVSAPRSLTMPRAVARKLALQVSFEFADVPVDEAIAFLRQATGVNMVLAPQVLASGTHIVTFSARDMTAHNALRWIMRQTGLHMSYTSGALFISDRPMVGKRSIRLYDVSDVINGVRDFPGPDLGVPSAGGGAGEGFDLFGGGQRGEDGEQRMDLGELAEFLEEHLNERMR